MLERIMPRKHTSWLVISMVSIINFDLQLFNHTLLPPYAKSDHKIYLFIRWSTNQEG